ncbi:MAG TPA: peptidase M20 [Syntrophomonas sp.]|jgi:tripeptide aminopeptidase|nr:peptidase M20 [Syntrophomonas sp.]HCF71772.1 peptidase M20 [Syntrophomonas sp.]
MINRERLIQRFIQLAGISSGSGQEGNLRDFLKQEYKHRGLDVYEDETGQRLNGNCGNLMIKIPGDSRFPALLLGAHMDTVQPCENIKPVIGEDGIIRSEGNTILSSDDKAGIAAIMEACDVMREKDLPHPPLEILFTVSEEQGLEGSKYFDYSLLQAGYGYVLDGGGDPGTIIVQSPCQNEIEYIVHGKAAHAGINPEDGINAIQVAAQAMSAMPCGRIDEETTCNFGLIEGGQARNIVASTCRIKGEARSLKREKLDELTSRLTDKFKAITKECGAVPEVNVVFLYPEISMDLNERVVRVAIEAAESIGLQPITEKTGGGSDASIITGHGIRCANLGTGMSNVHTTDEYIKIKDLENDARLVLAIIQQAARE